MPRVTHLEQATKPKRKEGICKSPDCPHKQPNDPYYGKEVQIFAHGLCQACDQRERRKTEAMFVRLRNPGGTPKEQRKEEDRVRGGYHGLMKNLSKLDVPKTVQKTILRMVWPRLAMIHSELSDPNKEDEEETS